MSQSPAACERLLGPERQESGRAFPASNRPDLEARDEPAAVRIRNVAERGKRALPSVEHVVEADLLFPLLRWADVARYSAVPTAGLLLVQDAQTRRGLDEALLRSRYPLTYAYFCRFRDVLCGRAAYRRYQQRAAFYSMYDVGPYTLAPIKVVWRRMDRKICAAVVEERDDPWMGRKPVVPQETCVLVAVDSAQEAHYLCALLNSAVAGFLAASHTVRGGKSFGTPSMLDYLPFRRFEAGRPDHRALAAASQLAHARAARGEDLTEVQHRIDSLAGRLLGLSRPALEALRREALEEG